MSKGDKKHQIRRVVAAVCGTPWAILPAKLDEIVEFLNLRAEGVTFSEDELRERFDSPESLMARSGLQIMLRSEPVDGAQKPLSYAVTESGVAVIPLDGVMAMKMNLIMRYSGGTSTEQFAAQVRAAGENDAVKAIVLLIDSPGGSVLGLENAADAVQWAAKKKRVVAVATGLMCSAAYYVGSAADEIVTAADAAVGSIGTVSVHGETSKADKKAGVKYTVIKQGKYKWATNRYEPLTAAAEAVEQEAVDSYYDAFVARVASNRGVTVAHVQANYGQGKDFIGTKAMELGMVDRIGNLVDVVRDLESRVSSTQKNTLVSNQENSLMDPKVMQALVAKGLIDGDTNKDTATAVLNTWYVAQGKTQPESVEDILADLAGKKAREQAEPAKPAKPPETPASEPSGGDAASQQGAAAERVRITEIQAIADIMGIDSAIVDKAIEDGTSEDAFRKLAITHAKEEPGVGLIESGRASADKFGEAAVEALGRRNDLEYEDEPSATVQALEYMPLIQMASECFRVQCGRAPIGDPDQIAMAALGDVEAMREMGIYSADTAYQTPGSFPNILSGLANKTLEQAPRYVGTTYQHWAAKRPSVPDFRPATLVRSGEFGEFPEHKDGEDFEQSELAEDYSWIQVDSYGDEFALTPVMMVNDDLGAFTEALRDKIAVHDATLNRLCVDLLTGNVELVDGNNLFDNTNHGNDITSGAAPNTAQLSNMRKKLRKQTGVGGRRKLGLTIKILLVPEDIETVTQQLLSNSLMIKPVQESTTPVFKGLVDWWVEPLLADNSIVKYYGFADIRRMRSIVYCHQRGFEKLKRRNYYNPKNNCRVWQFEARFAAAVNNYRGIVRNAGA